MAALFAEQHSEVEGSLEHRGLEERSTARPLRRPVRPMARIWRPEERDKAAVLVGVGVDELGHKKLLAMERISREHRILERGLPPAARPAGFPPHRQTAASALGLDCNDTRFALTS